MNENNNIPVISVNEVVQILSGLYVNVINKKLSINSIPAPFLWGAPGVGKSDAVYEIGDVIKQKTGKRVNVTDVRLLLFSPVDLRGVPVADVEHKFADWLMPRIFNMDSSDEVINILFLDELSAAPQSVQAAAYQITLNRTIGEHKLPDNTIVIAAGNRTTDRSVAYRMPNALANRLMHMEVTVSFESWRKWAEDNGVNPLVIGYLSFDNSKLHYDNLDLDDVAFTTPRSWVFVSDILNSMDIHSDGFFGNKNEDGFMNIDSLYHVISACIGKNVALEFIAWIKVCKDLPKVQDIFDGKHPLYPKTQDALYALIASILTYVYSSKEHISVTELEHMCIYSEKFPQDFRMMLNKFLIKNEVVKVKLLKIQSFKEWCKKNSKALVNDL